MVSIVIPNFNGANLLKKNLPQVTDAGADEIIVIDDASSDDSVKIIKKFGDIQLIQNKKNFGFVKSVNLGVAKSKGDITVLLNNDTEPEKDFLKSVIPYFKDKKIFAVTLAEPQFSWAKAVFSNGFVVHSSGEKTAKPHISFWASGGSAAFSKDKWMILGGMDELYHPFYWEDIDISYRAAKRGWEIWWEPVAVVHHEHGATIEKYFSRSYRDYMAARNQLIFIWKNITNEKMFQEHKIELFKKLRSGRMWRPFLATLTKIRPILEKRRREKMETKISDEEIFKKFI